MKHLSKLTRTVALVLIFCLVVSIPAYASDYIVGSNAKFNVTYKNKTVLLMNKGNDKFTLASLKKSWGAPKVTKQNGRNVYTYKAGKSYVELIPWSVENTAGYSVTICAKDKNIKVNGVSVGMTKKAATKSLKKSFGKAKVKIGVSSFFSTEKKTVKCIQVYYGGFMPMELLYNAKGKITKIYFWHS